MAIEDRKSGEFCQQEVLVWSTNLLLLLLLVSLAPPIRNPTTFLREDQEGARQHLHDCSETEGGPGGGSGGGGGKEGGGQGSVTEQAAI